MEKLFKDLKPGELLLSLDYKQILKVTSILPNFEKKHDGSWDDDYQPDFIVNCIDVKTLKEEGICCHQNTKTSVNFFTLISSIEEGEEKLEKQEFEFKSKTLLENEFFLRLHPKTKRLAVYRYVSCENDEPQVRFCSYDIETFLKNPNLLIKRCKK